MELREKYEKENGHNVYAYRQDYAGARPYQDGFNDEYVEWLESKVENLSLCAVSKSVNCEHTGDEILHQGNGFIYKTCADCGEDI